MALNLLMLFSAGTTQLEQLGAEPLRGELSDHFIHWRLSGSHTHLRVGLFSLLGPGLDPWMQEAGSSGERLSLFGLLPCLEQRVSGQRPQRNHLTGTSAAVTEEPP